MTFFSGVELWLVFGLDSSQAALGMYTVCTFRLAQALGLPWLLAIPRVTFWFALAAWVVTMAGLVGQLLQGVRS